MALTKPKEHDEPRKGPYSEDDIIAFRAELRGLKHRCKMLAVEAGEIEDKLVEIRDKLNATKKES